MKYLRAKTGFTLLELMVVVIVIGILATIAVPMYTGARDRATGAEAFTNLKAILDAEKAYRAQNSAWATSMTTLVNQGYIDDPNVVSGHKFTYTSGTAPDNASVLYSATTTVTGGKSYEGAVWTDGKIKIRISGQTTWLFQ